MLNLYHYSLAKYDRLLSRRAQGITLSETEQKRAEKDLKTYFLMGHYNDHISFFFEPVPLDIMGALYGKDHPVWKPGQTLYEYTIPFDTLPEGPYSVVETPLCQAFLYGEAYQKLPDHEWFKQRYEEQRKAGEVGTNHSVLKKQVYTYQGKTRDFFIRATQRKEFADYRLKYAANVPHLMLYPESGCVDYASVKTVKVGQTAVYGSSKWVPKHAI